MSFKQIGSFKLPYINAYSYLYLVFNFCKNIMKKYIELQMNQRIFCDNKILVPKSDTRLQEDSIS